MIDLNGGSHDDDSHAILRIGATAIKMIKLIAMISRKVKEGEAMRKYILLYMLQLTRAVSCTK